MCNKKKVIIDTDPGIDDSLALMYALSSPEIDVIGLTIVSGNVPAKQGAKNALKVLKFMNRLEIPVYLGATTPLVREYVSAEDTHGLDGLGESGIEEVEGNIYPDAANFIVKSLKKESGVSILAIGPLTNIAQALQLDEKAFANLERLVSMGGNFKSHGNCSPVAEYNYWCDPDAAKYVYEQFEHLGKIVEMIGLDVTRKIVLTPNIVSYIKRLSPKKGAFVEKFIGFYFDFHWEYEKIIGCVINDPLAIAYFIEPSLCEGFLAYTTVETQGICIGQSVTDEMNVWKKRPNSKVCIQVDARAFMVSFIHRIFGGNEVEISSVLQQIMVQE